jgi:hypothetical protein
MMAETQSTGSAVDAVQCPLNGSEGETADTERISTEKLMDVYFIRHTDDMDVDDATRKVLWDNRLVGFHFPFDKEDPSRDSERTTPEYYTDRKARRALFALNQLARDGGFVFSTHYPHNDQFMLGVVERCSKIAITRGMWGNKYGLAPRTACLKTLALDRVRLIQQSDIFYGLLKAKTGMFGTIHRVRHADIVRNLINHTEPEPIFDNLEPSQQEIMCSEALRLSPAPESKLPQMTQLLARTGGSMPKVDIRGIAADGKLIAAQVTHSSAKSTIDKKHQALEKWGESIDAYLLLFCDVEQEVMDNKILTVPIQQTFQRFTGTNQGMRWLRMSLGLKILDA